MNYVFVIPDYPLGGAERQVMEMAKKGVESGLNVKIVSLKSKEKSYDHDGVEILGLGVDLLMPFIKIRILRLIIRPLLSLYVVIKLLRLKADTYVFYNQIFIFLGFLISMLGKKKVCFSIREYSEVIFKPVNLFMLKRYDKLYTNTPRVQLEMSALNLKCEVFLNYVSLGSWSRGDRAVNEREGVRSILMVSNLEPHKNIDLLLNSACDFSGDIYICGKISNESYYHDCMKLAENINPDVHFLGLVNSKKLDELYLNCDLFVHASSVEGTSNAILDAIDYGIPLIISDIEENRFLIEQFEMLLFLDGSVSSLKSKIDEFSLNFPYTKELTELAVRNKSIFSETNLGDCWEYLRA